jgi:thioredoxin reductase
VKKQPKWQKDSMAAVHVIAANSEQPKENADKIMLRIRTSFESLKNGSTDSDHFDRIASAINVGLIRSESIAKEAECVMNDGVKALIECNDIFNKHGKYGFTGSGIVAMNEAIELYEQMVRMSTPKQMLDAMDIVIKRMYKQVKESK